MNDFGVPLEVTVESPRTALLNVCTNDWYPLPNENNSDNRLRLKGMIESGAAPSFMRCDPFIIPFSPPLVGAFRLSRSNDGTERFRRILFFDISESMYESLQNSRPRLLLLLQAKKLDESAPVGLPADISVSCNHLDVFSAKGGFFDRRSLSITKYVRVGQNWLHLSTDSESSSDYAFGVVCVQQFTISNLLRLAVVGHCLDLEDARELDLGMMRSKEGDVEHATSRLRLTCSVTDHLLGIPVRSSECEHIQCFDLNNFLKMNARHHRWLCPLCHNEAPFCSLIVDPFFLLLSLASTKFGNTRPVSLSPAEVMSISQEWLFEELQRLVFWVARSLGEDDEMDVREEPNFGPRPAEVVLTCDGGLIHSANAVDPVVTNDLPFVCGGDDSGSEGPKMVRRLSAFGKLKVIQRAVTPPLIAEGDPEGDRAVIVPVCFVSQALDLYRTQRDLSLDVEPWRTFLVQQFELASELDPTSPEAVERADLLDEVRKELNPQWS